MNVVYVPEMQPPLFIWNSLEILFLTKKVKN